MPDYIPKMTVEVQSTHVYFYAEVDSDRCLALTQELISLDSQLRNEAETRRLEPGGIPIWLHIHTPGGDLMAAFAVADAIASLKTPVHSVAEGMCASAGTILSMACHKRFITPNTFMLIHQLSSWVGGTHEQIKDAVKLHDKLMDRAVRFYVEHSKMDEKTVRRTLKHDSWFSADEALAVGIADEVYR